MYMLNYLLINLPKLYKLYGKLLDNFERIKKLMTNLQLSILVRKRKFVTTVHLRCKEHFAWFVILTHLFAVHICNANHILCFALGKYE